MKRDEETLRSLAQKISKSLERIERNTDPKHRKSKETEREQGVQKLRE
jgi:hypothetical protein